jgi:hypothetical protein
MQKGVVKLQYTYTDKYHRVDILPNWSCLFDQGGMIHSLTILAMMIWLVVNGPGEVFILLVMLI